MKRDWEIIRNILLKTEGLVAGKTLRASDFDGTESEIIAYHVQLLKEAELIDAEILPYLGSSHCHFDIHRLTWTGHDFLDSIRNNNIWEKTKSTILNKSSSMTFDVIKSVAIKIAMELISS
ncbi:DUF2513 domain-containing protein [Methylomonas sp. MO1]|uniref:DUF2513 domain-containing protein n=1 Tax=Methylomonas sp. MO1 TaxID=3073619 RepID=UPI0028A4EF36|nr:DUF2513 domain-containing protein [Methylomonas sp. MO1]MDT4290720.1 DUF2513 domain-containing protein [Methylomonas sp. MO1]